MFSVVRRRAGAGCLLRIGETFNVGSSSASVSWSVKWGLKGAVMQNLPFL